MSFAGSTLGFFVCRTLMMAMTATKNKMGTPTPANTEVPATDRPNTMPGMTRNTTKRYRKANQRYLAVVLPSIFARLIGTLRITGTGYQMRMPKMLKKRCESATWRVCWKTSRLDARAARMAVKVVPMLAPSVSGYMRSRCRIPTPTSGVRADVKTELLCTNIVKPAPINMAT